MGRISKLFSTSIGKKVSMALSGIVLVFFLIGHMTGNLKYFQGVDPADGRYKLDKYAEFLREIGQPLFGHGQVLWLVRAVLLICIAIHVIAALQLALQNAKARKAGYRSQSYSTATIASRNMRRGGVILLLFIIYHILHFTTGTVATQEFVHGQVFDNVKNAFQVWWVLLIYTVAMAVLFGHLKHGLWSLCQTLGFCNPGNTLCLRRLSVFLSLLIALGFLAVPWAVFLGMLEQ